MNFLEEKIAKYGKIYPGNIIKVDSFLNHQMDYKIIEEIAKTFYDKFKNLGINKILTIEASGIGIGLFVAKEFDAPLLFAKKNQSANIGDDLYKAKVHSYTKNVTNTIVVSKNYLNKEDKVLIIDDFLANGEATMGLIDLVNQACAEVKGIGICIEKGFQQGGKLLREKGYNLHSIAIIDEIQNNKIKFR